ncbi:MAG: helicase-related protein [Myxococcota bacterium]
MINFHKILQIFTNQNPLKSNQEKALEKIIYQRKNLLLDAPPAWGKTVVIYGAALYYLSENRPVVIALPYRQLVNEKFKQIQKHYEVIKNYAGEFEMDILLGGDPPSSFQNRTNSLIFTTYEYLYYNHISFIKTDLLCFDEAQMITHSHRNITLIKAIAYFAIHKHCRLILSGYKIPLFFSSLINPVEKILIDQISHNYLKYLPNHKNYNFIKKLVKEILEENRENLILIFVSTVKSTNSLSKKLNLDLSGTGKEKFCSPFNSTISDSDKQKILDALAKHKLRCIVSTTALTTGMDLPFSHVIIRDIKLPGRKRLNQMEIEQISGRCGRGSKTGLTYILHKEEEVPKRSPELPIFDIFSIFLLSWLKNNYKSSWENLSRQIMSLDFFEKKFLSVNLYLQKLIRSDLVDFKDNTYMISLTGEKILKGPFSISCLVRWQNFWKKVKSNSFTYTDFLFSFSICFNSDLLPPSSNFSNCDSIFWNRWLKHENYQIILNSFVLQCKNSKYFCLKHFNFACKVANNHQLSDTNKFLIEQLFDLGRKKLIYPHNLEFWDRIEREYKYEKNCM